MSEFKESAMQPEHISASDASERFGLTRAYITRLCKSGEVSGKMDGGVWFVSTASLIDFVEKKAHQKALRRRQLASARALEYKQSAPLREDARAAPGPTALPHVRTLHKDARAVIRRTPKPAALWNILLPRNRSRALLVGACSMFFVLAGIAAGQTLVSSHVGAHAISAIRLQTNAIARDVLGFTDNVSGKNIPAAMSLWHVLAPSMALLRPATSGGDALGVGTSAGAYVGAAAAATSLSTSAPPARGQSAAIASVLDSSQSLDAAAVPTAISATQVANAVKFSGAYVSYGDIVSYSGSQKAYVLSTGGSTQSLYGVVVQDPALLYQPAGGGTVPVVSAGPALMNVTLENGPVAIGDPLTFSSVPGKAKKASAGDKVIGTAMEGLTSASAVTIQGPNGSNILAGSITVDTNLRNITPLAGSESSNAPQCTSLLCRALTGINANVLQGVVRYMLASLIAVISLLLAFRSFVTDANYGVISIGRNPRAKTSIQSMVYFNAFLAAAIAGGGLFAAMMMLFAAA